MLMPPNVRVSLLPDEFVICRLDPEAQPPAPAERGPGLWSLTCSPTETSLVCRAGEAPAGGRVEPGWRALRIHGPLDFSLVGVLESLLAPLAEAKVSVFVLSTFDTAYVLVRQADARTAVTALRVTGHHVEGTG